MKHPGIFAFFILICTAACSKKESSDCLTYERARFIEASLPAFGLVNQVIPVPTKFACTNGCGKFSSFETKIDGNTISVRVIAKYEGCVCPENIPTFTETYNLQVSTPGSYIVKFVTDEDAFLISQILIQ
jgi:hypothetical protein